MYTGINFKTKKEFKEAVAMGEEVRIFQAGGIYHPVEEAKDYTGKATIEGPHYPAPHTWYASVELVNGLVTKVR